MLKKIGLPAIALLGMLAMAPHQANAAVRSGVVVDPAGLHLPGIPGVSSGGRGCSARPGGSGTSVRALGSPLRLPLPPVIGPSRF